MTVNTNKIFNPSFYEGIHTNRQQSLDSEESELPPSKRLKTIPLRTAGFYKVNFSNEATKYMREEELKVFPYFVSLISSGCNSMFQFFVRCLITDL